MAKKIDTWEYKVAGKPVEVVVRMELNAGTASGFEATCPAIGLRIANPDIFRLRTEVGEFVQARNLEAAGGGAPWQDWLRVSFDVAESSGADGESAIVLYVESFQRSKTPEGKWVWRWAGGGGVCSDNVRDGTIPIPKDVEVSFVIQESDPILQGLAELRLFLKGVGNRIVEKMRTGKAADVFLRKLASGDEKTLRYLNDQGA